MFLSRQITQNQTEYGRTELFLLLIAAIFVGINAAALSLAEGGGIVWQHLWAPAAWLLVITTAALLLNRYKPGHDPFLLPLLALLTGWGLVLLDRLAPNFLGRQVIWFSLGTAVLLLIALLPRHLRPLRRYRYTLLITGLLLLAATLIFGVNPSGFGAALWLPIPLVGRVFFQPSELLKLLLVIFLASYFDEREAAIQHSQQKDRFWGTLQYLGPLLLMWGLSMILLVWQRDLGAATIFFILFLALLYLATGIKRYMGIGLLLLLMAAIFAYFAFDVVALRVDAWWNPWPEAADRAFQIVQSLYALAAGGFLGQGVGQGFPQYIPVVHSDFAFAAMAEEWGLIGSLTAVTCFMILAQRGMRITLMQTRPFRRYLAAGITILFAAQALLIMGGVTRLLPLTGVTLPFVSYGGSSLLVSSVMMGLLFYLSAPTTDYRPPVTSHRSLTDKRILQETAVIFIGFTAVAVMLVVWSAIRGPALLAREDNPRLVEAELRIRRGAILDRNGTILAETTGTENDLTRRYPLPAIGPAVGYYSFIHGTAGVEAGYDAILRGESDNFWADYWRRTLHQPQSGRSIRLSLAADWQTRADALLGDRQGAVLIMDIQTGEILAMVSHPGYDPNLLDEQFDTLSTAEAAPLLNRAVQGQYQPGRLLQPFILAAALEKDVINLDDSVPEANRPVLVDGQSIRCASPPPEPATWADVLRHQCPAPMLDLADRLGAAGLEDIFTTFGFYAAPDLPLAVDTAVSDPIDDPLLAGIGQDNLVLTPMQLALAWSALGQQGQVPLPRLVTAVEDTDGRWPAESPAGQPRTLISSFAVRDVAEVLEEDGRIEYTVQVISGPEGSTNTWYLGLVPAAEPRYALVLVLEDSRSPEEAASIGREILTPELTE